MEKMTFDYLTNPIDRVVMGATPALMQPINGILAPVALFQQRFIVAKDGIYIQARTPAMTVCLSAGKLDYSLPYGSLKKSVELSGGYIPYKLYQEICERAISASPNEYVCKVLYTEQKGYVLHEPSLIKVSSCEVKYSTDYDPETVFLDLHTHGNGDAFFSPTDDESDSRGGIYLASVLGGCASVNTITAVSRIVINGIFYPISWTPWEEE